MLLKDKVVIVSGIGPGLGGELALEAARQGAKLAIAARTPEKLDGSEAEIRARSSARTWWKKPCLNTAG
jgi:NAD(P)-dependent dehydrogenase (short-subunit alcohol dehydrogenase family)